MARAARRPTLGAAAKAAARAAGQMKYFTGRPCKNGHVAERWISCGSCLGCQAETKAKLKEHMAEYGKRWRAENRERVCGYSAKWRSKNPGAGARYMAERRRVYRDVMQAAERRRYAADPERFLVKTRAYLKAHKLKVASYARKRRARKMAAEGCHTADQIAELAVRQGFRCANCRTSIRKAFHADHIVPLVAGGSNWISNIQLLCPTCNYRKGPKDPIAFAQQEGRLL